MFNNGAIWQGHLSKTRDLLLSHLPNKPTIIDIGCGEGHFVRGLSQAIQEQGRFLGFDPNTTSESGVGVEFYPHYFEPFTDITEYSPDLLIMRHVLEHLLDPASFIDQLAWGAAQINKPVRLFAEMPCIDRVLQSNRLVDFFYEHPSQFTTQSFTTLMEQGGQILDLSHGYDGEVIYALIELQVPSKYQQHAIVSNNFYKQAVVSQSHIKNQLQSLIEAGKKVAIWGGTGKAAAFMHYFDVDATNFPLVVDSDLDKVGTHVPKKGQQIQYRDVLKNQQVDIVIIPTQWRARDIVEEMNKEGIHPGKILIENDGALINYEYSRY